MKTVIRHLRRAALLHEGDDPADGQLLELFLVRRDEAAFEALMRRHGPMVLGVCRRVLRNVHDAEDAFQATFLVLVRKAGCLRSRELLANWLYGVAYRTAMKARTMSAKRRAKEKQMPRPEVPPGETCEELLAQLDHELNRLPDKYRVPVVLCELEGRSRKEVARLLGMPEGTLSWRLAHAKKLLARKLSRYGTVAVGALLAEGAASACLSPVLRASTAKAVLTAGAVPAKVMALTEGVMKAMLLTKLKITVCAGALMVLAGVGATGLTYRATAQGPARESQPQAETRRPQADELEALRLEIEALRKSLQATRERVKTLEGEVSALKRKSGGTAGRRGMPGGAPGAPVAPGTPAGALPRLPGAPGGQPGVPGGQQGLPPGRKGSLANKAPADPVSDAEGALKKLRENPGDKQATEALERALKQLKEREKPKVPPGGVAP
jgi:RNA polymerase sigma factor (sigma-70 family)